MEMFVITIVGTAKKLFFNYAKDNENLHGMDHKAIRGYDTGARQLQTQGTLKNSRVKECMKKKEIKFN